MQVSRPAVTGTARRAVASVQANTLTGPSSVRATMVATAFVVCNSRKKGEANGERSADDRAEQVDSRQRDPDARYDSLSEASYDAGRHIGIVVSSAGDFRH